MNATGQKPRTSQIGGPRYLLTVEGAPAAYNAVRVGAITVTIEYPEAIPCVQDFAGGLLTKGPVITDCGFAGRMIQGLWKVASGP
jgi:hypothetical protein